MALRKVGVIFTAQGHAQYMSELKQVNQEMRTMATQAKLAVAQLGNNATITDTYSTKMKSMSSQIDVAQNRTKMLSDQQKILSAEQTKIPKLVDEANRKYKESNTITKDLKKSYTDLAKSKGEDAEETLAAEKAYKSSLRETNKLKKEMKDLELVYAQNSKQLEKLPNEIAKAELATVKLTNAQAKLHEEYRNSGGRLADTAKNWQDLGNQITNVGDRMSRTGDYLTTHVTVPIVATGAMALKAAMDWETGFAGVMKTNDEVVDSTGKVIYGYEQLENELRNLTATVPVAHADLAGIAENAGQLGIATQDVVGFTDVIAKLGHTTNLSYDEASTALAQFLNVTGSGTGTVSNLASSIVALGNNTAATEKDILMMSQRWATTGAMIGLTDDQITAMSATLISMGVNVEAGGSALQRFGQKVNSHVLGAGMDLEILAETAGVTATEFTNAWQNDPVNALELFLKGLDGVVKEGGNANALLKDLGITSVNEVNALLALAGGHEQLATALGLSASAYKENTALGDEFAVFAETTAAKVQIFKNRVNDLMIDFGGPLADAMTSALNAAEPWIEKLAEMAKGFSEMDEEGQRNILMWVGIVAAAGPALSIFGRITTAVGKTTTGIGKLIQQFGKWTTPKAITETASELGKIPGAATKAGGAAALFSNPWVIAGTVAIAGVSAFLAYLNHEAQAPIKAHQDAVEATEGKYQEWFDAVVAGNGTISELNEQGIAGAEEMAQAYANATDEIMKANRAMQEALSEQFGEKSAMLSGYSNTKLDFSDGSTYFFALNDLQKRLVETGILTEQEFANMGRIYDGAATMLGGALSSISQSKMNNEIVTAEWASAQITAVKDVATSTVENLRRVEEARIADINAQKEQSLITSAEASAQISAIKQQTDAQISAVETSQARIHAILKSASDANRKLNSEEVTTIMSDIMTMAEVTGQSLSDVDSASQLLGDNLEAVVASMGMTFVEHMGVMDRKTVETIAGMQDMEEKTKAIKKAMEDWGIVDPELENFLMNLSEVELNVDDSEVRSALSSITDLANAWADLTFEERLAQVETRGKEEIDELLKLLGVDWESLTPTQKEYFAQAEGGEALENILYLTEEWNRQTDPQKKFAVLETQIDSETLLGAIKARDLWNNADFMSLAMEIDTNAPDAKEQLVNLVNYFSEQQGLAPLQMETEALTEESQQKLAELIATYTGAPVDEVAEFLTSTNADETTSSIEGTGQALTDLGGRTATVTVNAIDNASGIIGSVGRGLSSLDGRSVTTYINTVSSRRDAYAEGGHIDAYATGGNIKWGGMFASGGKIPSGYQGIVGEAGPEIFTVTERGVSITPLNSNEKMRGVGGAVADEVSRQLGGSGGINLTINIDKPVVSNKEDINSLTNQIVRKASKMLAQQAKNKQKGRPAW